MVINEPLPTFEGIGLGSEAYVNIPKFSRLINGVLIRVIGTGGLTAAEAVSSIQVMQDSQHKITIEPALQRKVDSIRNGTDDTLPADYIYIPFARMGIPGSAWGAKDIGTLQLRIKINPTMPGGKAFTTLKGVFTYTPIAEPQNRGDVFVQTVISPPAPVAGWNEIPNLPWQQIRTLSHLLLDSDKIKEVEIYVGERRVYGLTIEDQLSILAFSPLYKLPAGINFFPVTLDNLGDVSNYIGLFEGGVRRDLKIRYYWDGAVANFKILAEGIEFGNRQAVATVEA